MGRENRQEAYIYLIDLSSKKGYVTVDDILDCSDDFNLPITDVDWLSNSITTRGVIVCDEEPVSGHKLDEDYDDYAQSDYDEIFNRVIEINADLEPLISTIRIIKPPQRGEFSRLKYQVAEGNAHARNRMIEMHLRFAVKTALQKAEAFDWPFEDTFNSAVCGLITAVDRYDPDSGNAFGSYANLCMMQRINRDMPVKNDLFYYPVHKKEDYYAIYPVLKEYGCVSCDWNMECEHIRTIIADKFDVNDDEKIVDDILLAIDCMESLDAIFEHIDEEDEYYYLKRNGLYHSMVDNNQEEQVFQAIWASNIIEFRTYLKENLRPREYDVLEMRYGFDGIRGMTLEEVGNCMNLTRERIRQIEKKAFIKLQNPVRMKYLKKYLTV